MAIKPTASRSRKPNFQLRFIDPGPIPWPEPDIGRNDGAYDDRPWPAPNRYPTPWTV